MAVVTHRPCCLLEGVPLLGWGTHRECTFAGALSAATQVTRYPVAYQTILGVTGLAYRVRWYQGIKPRWCGSSPCGEFRREVEATRRALGWSLDEEVNFEERLSASIPRIIDELEWGRPVLAYDPSMNMGVIVGFEDDGGTLLMHDYLNADALVRRSASELPRFAIYLGQRHRHLRVSEAALGGLRLGLEQWHERHDPSDESRPGYWMGAAAYEHWALDLATVGHLRKEEQENLFFVSWWNFDVTADTHAYAPKYLRKILAFYPKTIALLIEEAARIYDESNEIVQRCFKERNAFLGPWSGCGFKHWDRATREREVHVLMSMRNHEAEAMKILAGVVELAYIRQHHS